MAKSLMEIISGMSFSGGGNNTAPAEQSRCANCNGSGIDPIEGGDCLSCAPTPQNTNNTTHSGIVVNSAERRWGVMDSIREEIKGGEDVIQ